MKQLIALIATLLITLAAAQSMAIPVTVAAYAEYPDSAGTAIGTGTGDLINGVLTYEMEYVIDIVIFDPAILTIYGTLFDGAPPTGISAISACEGELLICSGVVLDAVRDDSFVSGGPFSETEVTILHAGVSASGRTPPSTLTITPVAEVPLPGTAWLIGAGLIGLAGIKRKK